MLWNIQTHSNSQDNSLLADFCKCDSAESLLTILTNGLYTKTEIEIWFWTIMKDIDFTKLIHEDHVVSFYCKMNDSIIELIKTLPKSIQNDATLFCMEYAKISIGESPDFFRHYYTPVYSIIAHLLLSAKIDEALINNLASLHALILLLHSLDDHLHDGEIPASHTTVLIRSQAWHIRENIIESLNSQQSGILEKASELTDTYYSAISRLSGFSSLKSYISNFSKQAATVLIAPFAAACYARLNKDKIECMLNSLTHFLNAWRVLDDIHDAEEDCNAQNESAVSLLLNETSRNKWLSEDSPFHTLETDSQSVTPQLLEIVNSELKHAADYAFKAGLVQWAQEIKTCSLGVYND